MTSLFGLKGYLPARGFAACTVTLLLLTGCANTPQTDYLTSRSFLELSDFYELRNVPFYRQQEYQCGPAALAMALGASGVDVKPDDLTPKVYLPERRGSLQVELVAAGRSYGRVAYQIAPSLESLVREVQAGNPVVVLQNLGLSWIPQWHFAVAIGYDLTDKKLILHSGNEKRYVVKMKVFENTWRRSGYWGAVFVSPETLPATASADTWFQAVSAFERKNDDKMITKAYQSGLQKWPQNQLLNMGLGNLLYKKGDLAGAAQSYEKILSNYPNYAPAYNNLAQVYFEMGDISLALQHARTAVDLGGPHKEQYQRTLASILKSN